MADNISRISSITQRTLTLTNDVSTSQGFSMAQKAGGIIHVHSLSSGSTAAIQFYSVPNETSALPGGAFAVADATNTLLSLTIQASRCYALPDELFAAMRVIPVLTSNITASITVSFKT